MPLQYKFDQLLDFPCDQHLRIIVLNDSYTVRVRFNSAEQIEMLYRELPKLDFVKHLL